MSLDKFLACIYGVALGDALGMPFETMAACEIRNRAGEVSGFRSPSLNPHIFSSLSHLLEGSWTDDTQLTLATMNAFIEADGRFDMQEMRDQHVKAYKDERRGWGGSTRRSCKRLADGKHWSESGEPNGLGNGVMMKITPLGLWQTFAREHPRTFVDMCVEYARMTHLGTPAIVGGVVHAFVINTLARRDYACVQHILTFLDFFKELALVLEAELPPWEDKISDQIEKIIIYGMRGELGTASPETIASWFGGGTSYAYNSFGLSYALFSRSECIPDNPNPFNAVFDAVNAGGDTDSNASIVGSLVGALHGMSVIPQELIMGVEKAEMIGERTEKFFEVCGSRANG